LGARCTLVDLENPLRLNFFSAAIRILFEHMMGTLAPINQVKQSGWFVAEKPDGLPARWQRVVFALQGGLTDDFVINALSVDVQPLRKRLLTAVDDLSKQMHAREATIVDELSAQDAAASATIEAFSNFLQTYHDCRLAILSPIQEALDNAAIEALLEETIQEIAALTRGVSRGLLAAMADDFNASATRPGQAPLSRARSQRECPHRFPWPLGLARH
jgi:hypothetical protein